MATSSTGDKVPLTAVTRARNAAWLKIGFPSKRQGTSIVVGTSQSGKHPILALGNFLGMNWSIDDLGRWSKVVTGALQAIDAGNTTPFTAGTKYPVTAIANNYLFAVNGTDAKKTDGTTVTNFGFAAPTTLVSVLDSGVAGNMTGTYSFALTSYNETSGHESSLGASQSVTVTAKKINVTWTFPTDPQITKIRVHIFKLALTDRFFRIDSVNVTPLPDSTTGGYPSSTLTITVNMTDTDINNLIVQSPSTTENNPPPTGTTFIAYHGSRMFATDGVQLYFSKVNDPESFDPARVEPVNSKDGQKILAFASLSSQHLVILKERSSHLLVGPDDPNTWEVLPFDPAVGIVSVRSLTFSEGSLWWEALQGLFKIDYIPGSYPSMPQRMDSPNISDRLENLADSLLGTTIAAYDNIRQRVFFAAPTSFATANDILLPYNVKIKVWEDIWDPLEISAMGEFIVNGAPYIAVGGYGGRIFRLWDGAYVDGVRQVDSNNISLTLTGTPTSATATTLDDLAANFDTAGDGLADIKIVAVAPDGTVSQNTIGQSGNTSTHLTMKYSWTVTPDATWTYYIGSPNFEVDTKHMLPTSVPGQEGSMFNMRTFKHIFIKGLSDTGRVVMDIYAMLDGNTASFAGHVQVPLAGGGAKWDTDQWDLAIFGAQNVSTIHRSLGLKGRTLGLRFASRLPGDGLVVLGAGLFGTELGYKA